MKKMFDMLCPAGEHCARKSKGEVCLMWHPSLAPCDSELSEVGRHKKLQDEEEMLVQLALKKSLEPVKVPCQFCGFSCEDQNELQIHQVNCSVIGNSKPRFAGQEETSVYPSKTW